MAKVIVIANQKGGVAKTTTAASLGAGLSRRGYKVLLIDTDPQGNLSDSVGADNQHKPTCYEVLKREVQADEAVQHINSFDIIPSNIMLASADVEFTTIGKEQRLKETIQPIENNYDYIIIDTPPSLGILTMNAFTYANEVIIPTKTGIFAATGITQLFQSIETVLKYCNPQLKVVGILITDYDPRTIIGKDIKKLTETIGTHMDVPIYKTTIRHSVKVEEAQANKTDIYTYDKGNNVSIDYTNFIDEYLKGENK